MVTIIKVKKSPLSLLFTYKENLSVVRPSGHKNAVHTNPWLCNKQILSIKKEQNIISVLLFSYNSLTSFFNVKKTSVINTRSNIPYVKKINKNYNEI